MTVMLFVCIVLGSLASLATGALAVELHRSDPAGNGLTRSFLLIALVATWLLVSGVALASTIRAQHDGPPAALSWPAIDRATIGLLMLAIGAQFAAFAALRDATVEGWLQRALAAVVTLLPLAFLLHAAWRLGMSLPWALAGPGCASVVVAGSLLALIAGAGSSSGARAAATREPAIALPALLVEEGELVRVLRDLAALHSMPSDLLRRLRAPFVVDANCHRYVLHGLRAAEGAAEDAAVPVVFTAVRDDAPLSLSAVRDLVLGVPRLHPEQGEDARIRRLVGMQRSVTALSFVLPR